MSLRPVLHPLAIVTPKEGKEVCGVAASPDGLIWTGYKNCVRKIDPTTGEIFLEVKTRSGKFCTYLACLMTGELLVTYGGSTHIDKVTRMGTFGDFADLKPYKCYDIVVSKKNEVGVCLKGGNLAVISEKGQVIHKVKMGKMSGFTVTNDGNYLMVDCGNGMSIVTMDGSGRHVRDTFILQESWDIERVVCDWQGNIIGLNHKKELFIINTAGLCVQKYKVPADKKVTLNCMSVDRDGNLIFGASDGKVIIVSYFE